MLFYAMVLHVKNSSVHSQAIGQDLQQVEACNALHSASVSLIAQINGDGLGVTRQFFRIQPRGGGGNFNRQVTGVCYLTSEIAP